MKNFVLTAFITCIALALLSATHQENKGLARVRVIQGKEVYVMCDPLRDYTIVEDVNSFGTASNSTPVANIVDAYIWKANKKKVDYDALIIDGSSKASLVKWK